jgi:hypothetical protein
VAAARVQAGDVEDVRLVELRVAPQPALRTGGWSCKMRNSG